MFESAELGHTISKAEYRREEPRLREALLVAQYRLLAKPEFPVIILIGGVDGAGKGETVNLLNEWMDPRHIHTHTFGQPSDEERERPPMWRFWNALPPKGKIGILFGSWYTDPIVERVLRRTRNARLEQDLEAIRHFETMVVAEGALLLKLWFHLSKKALRQRLETLEADPRTRWRVTKADWKNFKRYDAFRSVSEHALRETSTGEAPWTIIEGADAHYRYLTAGRLLLDQLQRRLRGKVPALPPPTVLPAPPSDGKSVLSTVDYSRALAKSAYEKQLEKYQGRLALATRGGDFRKRSLIVVFEGMDAAGKGSSIRRITAALDARHYQVIPIAAPAEEERAQPYLWRFWRHLPRQGRVTIFDRSWYGRVLVERVENLCPETAWLRAYHEINEFEEQLVRNGALVVKFWLTISKEEQLKRFHEREKTPFKQFKITPDDWRNRKQWPRYERAAVDMIARTSTEIAPWHVIAANDKYHARIEVLKTLCDVLKGA